MEIIIVRMWPWLAVISLHILSTLAKDKDLHCGACHMLVDTIDWEISQTDPKKTIQVGSFRIMPDGSQKLSEIPYKRSGVQISELLETACSKPNDYFQTSDEGSTRKLFKRQQRRDNQASSLTNLVISKDNNKMLKFACEGIAEDNEDEIVEVFSDANEENYLKAICVDVAGACTEAELYDVNPNAHDLAEIAKKAEAEQQKIKDSKTENKSDNTDSEEEDEDESDADDEDDESDSNTSEQKDEL